MIKLEQALRTWGTPGFEAVLKQEISRLDAGQLPLQQGLTTGNYVVNTPISVTINSIIELENMIRVDAGIFYRSIISGCSCEGDPTPTSENNEYCEVRLEIDKTTAATTATLVE